MVIDLSYKAFSINLRFSEAELSQTLLYISKSRRLAS